MKEISVQELQLNPMTLIAKRWMLITAGTEARGSACSSFKLLIFN